MLSKQDKDNLRVATDTSAVEELSSTLQEFASAVFMLLPTSYPAGYGLGHPTTAKMFIERCVPAVENAQRIVMLAVIDSYQKCKAANAVASSEHQFYAHNTLSWAEWMSESVADGIVLALQEANMSDPSRNMQVMELLEAVGALGKAWIRQHGEALRIAAGEDARAALVCVMFEAAKACATACILGLNNAEIFPFPRRMYDKLAKAGKLKAVDGQPALPVYALPTLTGKECALFGSSQLVQELRDALASVR